MDFSSIVENALHEQMLAGGVTSVFGPGVANTATPFSGDNYAPNDARNIFGGVMPGVQTRFGTTGRKSKKKNRRKSKKKANRRS